jgi:hypothetical protein
VADFKAAVLRFWSRLPKFEIVAFRLVLSSLIDDVKFVSVIYRLIMN